MIPKNYPANIRSPVEQDSSIGYVTSTPNSKPTGIIGIIQNPITKQHIVTSHDNPVKKLKAVPTLLTTDKTDIIMTESLYVFLSSTHNPKHADPNRPPMMNTAPNSEASDYMKISNESAYWLKIVFSTDFTNDSPQRIEYSLNKSED